MATYIKKPEMVEAVKWDGSPEGAAEVKDLLDKAGYHMGDFAMRYDNEGSPITEDFFIEWSWKEKEAPKPGDAVKWEKYKLGQWMVLDPNSYPKIKVMQYNFERDYQEVGLINEQIIQDWVLQGKGL